MKRLFFLTLSASLVLGAAKPALGVRYLTGPLATTPSADFQKELPPLPKVWLGDESTISLRRAAFYFVAELFAFYPNQSIVFLGPETRYFYDFAASLLEEVARQNREDFLLPSVHYADGSLKVFKMGAAGKYLSQIFTGKKLLSEGAVLVSLDSEKVATSAAMHFSGKVSAHLIQSEGLLPTSELAVAAASPESFRRDSRRADFFQSALRALPANGLRPVTLTEKEGLLKPETEVTHPRVLPETVTVVEAIVTDLQQIATAPDSFQAFFEIVSHLRTLVEIAQGELPFSETLIQDAVSTGLEGGALAPDFLSDLARVVTAGGITGDLEIIKKLKTLPNLKARRITSNGTKPAYRRKESEAVEPSEAQTLSYRRDLDPPKHLEMVVADIKKIHSSHWPRAVKLALEHRHQPTVLLELALQADSWESAPYAQGEVFKTLVQLRQPAVIDLIRGNLMTSERWRRWHPRREIVREAVRVWDKSGHKKLSDEPLLKEFVRRALNDWAESPEAQVAVLRAIVETKNEGAVAYIRKEVPYREFAWRRVAGAEALKLYLRQEKEAEPETKDCQSAVARGA